MDCLLLSLLEKRGCCVAVSKSEEVYSISIRVCLQIAPSTAKGSKTAGGFCTDKLSVLGICTGGVSHDRKVPSFSS